ncbi:MAG: hypothetical protein Q7J85_10660 [Bacillota bacterium]|nr:hypothetical protein [Bacillota bacterium]
MELNILQWIFQTIPECLALASLAVVLSGRGFEVKNIFLISLPHAIAVYLVRLLPLSFGVHFIIFIVLLAVNLNLQLKIRFNRSLLTSLVALIILAAAEIALVTLMYSITDITYEEARENLFLWIVYGWPHIIFLFLLAMAIGWWRKGRGVKPEEYDA